MGFFRFAAVSALAVSLLFCGQGEPKKSTLNASVPLKLNVKKKDYNVLLITIDTWRFDRCGLFCPKYVKTPHIDELGQKSFAFKNAFAHNPATLPSHVNILTGTTPLYHGISDNSGFKLDDRFLTIAEYLKQAHYRTSAFIGAFPLDSRFGLTQGFDRYDDNYGTYNSLDFFFVERRAEKVIELASDWISRQQNKWFSWVHLFDPHQPYLPPEKYSRLYATDLYSGEVAYVDACLGKLFDLLKKRHLLSDTIIIITGDHGEALGEKGEQTHAYFAYNNTIHIPLILYIPDAGSGFIEENVTHTDIFPTICDLLDLKIPSHIQGESLLPIIRGKRRDHDEIYFESLTPFLNRGWAPLRGFIRGHIKFIDLPVKEVYNLKQDSQENKNLARQSKVPKLKADLMRLQKKLAGDNKIQRSATIDSETRKKLETLGYVSGSSFSKKKNFTVDDDLKTMLPIQNSMLDALNDFQNGKVAKSLRELEAVAEKSPSFVLVYRNMATIYKKMGQIDKAVDILKKGLARNPENVNLMAKLGIMLAEAGQPDEAINLLEKSVKMDEFDPEMFNYLGVAYYRKGNFQSALENYRKVLDLDTNYAPVYNNLGSLYLVVYQKKRDSRAYESSMQNFNRALEIDPKLFSALNGRASAYYFQNQAELAQRDWQKCIEVNPDFGEAYFNIGISYLNSGDKQNALKYFQLCKERLYDRFPVEERQRLDRLIVEAGN
jgi:arylsulfatase A-like enzyme/Flp pilus assembly protein TadD